MSVRVMQRLLVLGVVLGSLLAAESGYTASRRDLAKRIERGRVYLEDIEDAPDKAIPTSIMRDCKGMVILRQYKVGFVFGAKVGQGIVIMRDEKTGRWGAPAFITSGEGSFGFQIGGQAIDAIFLVMNRDGVEMLLKTKFKIGVDASAAAGPLGRDAAANVGPGTAILVYSRASGLYAGAVFEGGLLVSDDDANAEFYGKPGITFREILLEKDVKVPAEAKPLIRDLEKYAAPEK